MEMEFASFKKKTILRVSFALTLIPRVCVDFFLKFPRLFINNLYLAYFHKLETY